MINKKILEFIEDNYEVDYHLVGEKQVKELVNTVASDSTANIIESEEGSPFDVVYSLEVIILIIEAFILINKFRDNKKKAYIKEEMISSFDEKIKKIELKSINHSDVKKIFEEVLSEFDDEQ